MVYYFKQIDVDDNVTSLITCNQRLKESTTQIEITEAEYAKLYATLPQPEEADVENDPNTIIDILTGEVE